MFVADDTLFLTVKKKN